MQFNGISVVLPVYLETSASDSLSRLSRAALSVLEQESSLPIELIVVDDGCPAPLSSQTELSLIFSRPEVRSVKLAPNAGLVFALNAGLQRASYDLIARIDADDCWLPGKLASQIAAFAADSELTLAGTGMRVLNGRGEVVANHVRGASWRDVLSFSVSTGCPFPHGSILARADVFRLLGGYPHESRFRHCEDFALWSAWVRFFKCAMIEEAFLDYTLSANQISSRHAREQQQASDRIRQSLASLGDLERIPDALAEIANLLQMKSLQASKILALSWRFYDSILVDAPLLEAVRTILPDRTVAVYDGASALPADRFFYLQIPGSRSGATPSHARSIHTQSHLSRLIT